MLSITRILLLFYEDFALDLDLILIWIWIWIWAGFGLIWVGFGLILVGFGLIWLGFWSIIAFRARIALLGGPRKLQVGFVEAPSEILPELQKLQKL